MDKEKLLDILIDLIEEHNVPAVQVGIVKDGEIIFNEAVGYRDYENKIKADTRTLFAIGSATKAFVAEAIAILVDEGKVEWDKPVQQYIPEFRMYNNYVSENLTIRDILCHRSGLPRHDLMWYLNIDNFSLEDIIHKIRYLEPAQPFRYKMQYQNHMFGLAGYLIERVTGKKWSDFVRERILLPLGMEDTNFSVEDSKKFENKALPYDYYHGQIKELPFRNIDVVGAAGSINSNIEDMLKWIKFNLAKGQWKKETIISKENIGECHSTQMVISEPAMFGRAFKEIEFFSYGLGWFVESYRGHKVIHHGGNIDGFSAMVSFIPSINTGFVILTNRNGNVVPYVVQNTLYDSLFQSEKIDWNSKFKINQEKAMNELNKKIDTIYDSSPKNTKPSLELESYIGEYENNAYGKILISVEEDKLVLRLNDSNVELKHICFDTFLVEIDEDTIRVPLQFRISATGKITGLGIELESTLGKMIEFIRL